jgi:hypothetical protein
MVTLTRGFNLSNRQVLQCKKQQIHCLWKIEKNTK